MARRDDVLGVNGAETVIGSGVRVTGNLLSEGDIMVDGNLTGDIQTTSDVAIGVNGQVKADIKARNITIAGSVTGTVTAEGEVTIRETGQVRGNITAGGLAIQSGGVFVGTSELNELAQPDKADGTN